jgi:hypothetical protein
MKTRTDGIGEVIAWGERRVSMGGPSEVLVPRVRGVSHAFALRVWVAAAVVVVVLAPAGRATVSVTIYGAGLIALFGGSALYHRWPGPPRFKAVLQRIDHSTIFVFIAASYTPIALIVLHGALAWVILGVAWSCAAAGVAFSLGWIDAPRAVLGQLSRPRVGRGDRGPGARRARTGAAGLARRRRTALLDRRDHLREAATLSVAADIRLPRDLPCARDRRGCPALRRGGRLGAARGADVSGPMDRGARIG